ncbi:MAG: hypothetical protein M3Y64_08320 [Gemmatimonadota bacterium]|nr:hypothetical protein [Gemmatimonadota bacterium]
MRTPAMNRFLSIVLLLAVIPLIGLWALLIKISIPSPQGGMEPTMAMVAYIAATIIFTALSIVVVNFSIQLRHQANGQFETP